ncbi:SH3 domain-containing protein [Niallia sp. 03133]|uniref:SH3 domain-containing protein n=1 Tax=Niallia sp. 03133 TaxID=3458060 RepID=UPI004043E480
MRTKSLVIFLTVMVAFFLASPSKSGVMAQETVLFKGETTASYLNVRKAPGTQSKIIGSLKKGSKVEIVKDGSWFKIKYKTTYGYVSAKYVKKVSVLTSKAESEKAVNKMKTVGKNQQFILVTTIGEKETNALIQTFSKDNNGKWKRVLSVNGIVGKKGIQQQISEGSQSTPAGRYTITTAFGRQKNPGTKLSYHRITSDDVWVDNINSKYYNTLQSKKKTGEKSEGMNIPQYDYGFVIDYNTKRVKGKGSAIFFHIAKGSYTLGCTAVSNDNVVSILKWLDPKKKPVIIQTVESDISKY